jgi:hypothetical protein
MALISDPVVTWPSDENVVSRASPELVALLREAVIAKASIDAIVAALCIDAVSTSVCTDEITAWIAADEVVSSPGSYNQRKLRAVDKVVDKLAAHCVRFHPLAGVKIATLQIYLKQACSGGKHVTESVAIHVREAESRNRLIAPASGETGARIDLRTRDPSPLIGSVDVDTEGVGSDYVCVPVRIEIIYRDVTRDEAETLAGNTLKRLKDARPFFFEQHHVLISLNGDLVGAAAV